MELYHKRINMNKNVVFNLKGVKPDVIIFDPYNCPFENFKIGLKNGVQEWYVKIMPPNAYRWIELFVKVGDIIMVQEFFDRDNQLVSFTAISLPFNIADNYLECYDEKEDEYIDLENVFFGEPSEQELKDIESREIEALIEKSKHLTIEDLLEDEDEL
jgi:hypothetical protein